MQRRSQEIQRRETGGGSKAWGQGLGGMCGHSLLSCQLWDIFTFHTTKFWLPQKNTALLSHAVEHISLQLQLSSVTSAVVTPLPLPRKRVTFTFKMGLPPYDLVIKIILRTRQEMAGSSVKITRRSPRLLVPSTHMAAYHLPELQFPRTWRLLAHIKCVDSHFIDTHQAKYPQK